MKKKEDIFTKKKTNENTKKIKHKSKKRHISEEEKLEKIEKNKKLENQKNIEIGIIIGLAVIILGLVSVTILTKKDKIKDNTPKPLEVEKPKEEVKEVSKIKIVDVVSKTRPYAVTINNTPGAVKVQEGLNKAYLVYEFPTEGFTSRLLALYKDQKDLTIGTIRSARHNFFDYVKESDAIYVAYGYSHYAQDELKTNGIDQVNGIESKYRSAFWRSNPENLVVEHTAYTSLSKIDDYVTKNKYRLESKSAEKTIVLNYSENEINLNKMDKVKDANSVKLPYGNIKTVFKYNKETKEYTKYVNDKKIKDHKTGESITTKNIIIVKIGYKMMPDKKYWDLKNTGKGDGYYITNGKYVPIKWEKKDRNSRTKYTYLNGEEIEVNDGRTYIELFLKSRKITIK